MESNTGVQRCRVLVTYLFILAAIAVVVILGCSPGPAPSGDQTASTVPSGSTGRAVLTIIAVGPGNVKYIQSTNLSNPGACYPESTCKLPAPIGTEFVLAAAFPRMGTTGNLDGTLTASFMEWSGDADCADGRITLERDVTCIATFIKRPSGKYALAPAVDTLKNGKAGEPVRFSADATDADAQGNGLNGKIVSYEWDFMGDGVIDYKGDWLSHGLADFTFDTPGLYVMRLRVTDEDGLMNEFATRFRVK